MLPIIALKNIISTVNFQSPWPLLIAFVANSYGTFSWGVCSQCSLSSSVSFALELRYFVAASIFISLSSVSCWWCCLRWQLVQSYVLSTRSFLLLSSPSLLMLHFKSRADTKRYIHKQKERWGNSKFASHYKTMCNSCTVHMCWDYKLAFVRCHLALQGIIPWRHFAYRKPTRRVELAMKMSCSGSASGQFTVLLKCLQNIDKSFQLYVCCSQ